MQRKEKIWISDSRPLMFFNFFLSAFCSAPDWVNDGICDGITNIAFCRYDGGDCCKKNNLVLSDPTCTNCICYADHSETVIPVPGPPVDKDGNVFVMYQRKFSNVLKLLILGLKKH